MPQSSTKCKLCEWVTNEKVESQAMQELRKHWADKHRAEYREVKDKLDDFDRGAKFCITCGKSLLSAGFLLKCRCSGEFCSDCSGAHKMCKGTHRAVQAAA
jgi:hypothetical protein